MLELYASRDRKVPFKSLRESILNQILVQAQLPRERSVTSNSKIPKRDPLKLEPKLWFKKNKTGGVGLRHRTHNNSEIQDYR